MKLHQIGRDLINEKKDKHFFDYTDLSKEMWHKKIKEAQDKHKVHFDLENDYDIAQREVSIPQDYWEHFDNVKFRCELFSASGDWENSVLYFRCQLRDGYARDLHKGGYFIYFPSKDEGNTNLIAGDGGSWYASDNKSTKADTRPNEYKAWAGLKKYLQKLVTDEIAEVKKSDNQAVATDG